MSDRAATFERVLRPEPGRTALLVVEPEIQRATLHIVRRAFGRVVPSGAVIEALDRW